MRPGWFKSWSFVFIWVVTASLASGCNGAETATVAFDKGNIILEDPGSNRKLSIQVEIAETVDEARQGLMYRKRLPKGTGMIFIWRDRQVRTMWMKNTFIPLDMIFVDGEIILGFVEKAEPESLTIRSVGKPGNIVIELPGGYVSENGITTKWIVHLPPQMLKLR